MLKSIRHLTPADVAKQVVRGQYFAGAVGGEPRPGYRQEPKVKSDSNVETFVAMKLLIDNWRWSACRFICAPEKTCRKAPAKCAFNSPHAECFVRRAMRATS
ncbi:MAG: hypothetical protein WDM76_14900 [Limisphaerales bacterium]